MPWQKGPGATAFRGCKLSQLQWKQAPRRERWEDYWGSGNLTLPTRKTNLAAEVLVCSVSDNLQSVRKTDFAASAPVTLKKSVIL